MQQLSRIVSNLPSTGGRPTTRTSPDAAEAVAITILDSYGRDSVRDPDAWIDTAAAVLIHFAPEVVREAFEPGLGLQTRLKWPPKPCELREACERIVADHAARERRAMLAKHRVLIDGPQGLQPPEFYEPPTQDARDRAVAYWEEEVREELRMRELSAKAGEAPPRLSLKERQAWYENKLPELQARLQSDPIKPLSDAAKALMTRASLDRGARSDAAQ